MNERKAPKLTEREVVINGMTVTLLLDDQDWERYEERLAADAQRLADAVGAVDPDDTPEDDDEEPEEASEDSQEEGDDDTDDTDQEPEDADDDDAPAVVANRSVQKQPRSKRKRS